MTYTVKSVMPTGKSHDTYGTEFYVQFEEVEQAYPLWFKSTPEVGSTIEGEIKDGKFKKTKKPWNPDSSSAKQDKPASRGKSFKDNSDGMRQGMCFNNAANYVNTLEFKKALTDVEWADIVFRYAQALYLKGDLNVPFQEDQVSPNEESQDLNSVQEVFGPEAKPTGTT